MVPALIAAGGLSRPTGRTSWRIPRTCGAGLRGARVFVTGGTGFVGSWLLKSLRWANERLDAGIEAVVLTRDPDSSARRARTSPPGAAWGRRT